MSPLTRTKGLEKNIFLNIYQISLAKEKKKGRVGGVLNRSRVEYKVSCQDHKITKGKKPFISHDITTFGGRKRRRLQKKKGAGGVYNVSTINFHTAVGTQNGSAKMCKAAAAFTQQRMRNS